MKASELARMALAVVEHYGDIEVAILTDTPDGQIFADLEAHGAVIELPDEEGGGPDLTVLAVGWASCVQQDETPEFIAATAAAPKAQEAT